MTDTLFALIFLGALALFWQSSLRAREHAVRICRRACEETGAQMLDQTVHVERLRLGRGEDGRVRFRRWYEFEFSLDGTDRYCGVVVLLGLKVEGMDMSMPGGRIITLGRT